MKISNKTSTILLYFVIEKYLPVYTIPWCSLKSMETSKKENLLLEKHGIPWLFLHACLLASNGEEKECVIRVNLASLCFCTASSTPWCEFGLSVCTTFSSDWHCHMVWLIGQYTFKIKEIPQKTCIKQWKLITRHNRLSLQIHAVALGNCRTNLLSRKRDHSVAALGIPSTASDLLCQEIFW